MNDMNEKEVNEPGITGPGREKAFFEEEPWNTVVAFTGGILLAGFVIWLSRLGTASMGGG